MDFGKFLYKKKKQEQDAKKQQRGHETKTIRFGFLTGAHDIEIRVNQAKEFLQKGNSVKIQVLGRGRQLAYSGSAMEKVQNFIAQLTDLATVESPPKQNGGMIIAVIKPSK